MEDVTLDVDTANQVLSLNEEGGIVKGKIGVQKQNIGLSSDVATLKSNLENFMYDFTFKDDFNNQGKLDMGKYAFELKEMGTTTTLVLGGLKASSTLEEVSNQLQQITRLMMFFLAKVWMRLSSKPFWQILKLVALVRKSNVTKPL